MFLTLLKKRKVILLSVVLGMACAGFQTAFGVGKIPKIVVPSVNTVPLLERELPVGGVLGLKASLFPLAISAEMVDIYGCENENIVAESVNRLALRSDLISRVALWASCDVTEANALTPIQGVDLAKEVPGMFDMLCGASLYEVCRGLIIYTAWSMSHAQYADVLDHEITKLGDAFSVNKSLLFDLGRLAYAVAGQVQTIRSNLFPSGVYGKTWEALSVGIGEISQVNLCDDALAAFYKDDADRLLSVSVYAPRVRNECDDALNGNMFALRLADLHGRHFAGMLNQYNQDSIGVMSGQVKLLENGSTMNVMMR